MPAQGTATRRVVTADAGVLLFERVIFPGVAVCDFCGAEFEEAGWNHANGAHGDTLICDPCAEAGQVAELQAEVDDLKAERQRQDDRLDAVQQTVDQLGDRLRAARVAELQAKKRLTRRPRPIPQPLTREERERIRCGAASGIADPADTLRLLHHIGLQERAILQIGQRVEDFGTEEDKATAAAAQELVAEDAPIHIRIEFDRVGPPKSLGWLGFLDTVRDWTAEQLANLAESGAHATATYRGDTESWETPLP